MPGPYQTKQVPFGAPQVIVVNPQLSAQPVYGYPACQRYQGPQTWYSPAAVPFWQQTTSRRTNIGVLGGLALSLLAAVPVAGVILSAALSMGRPSGTPSGAVGSLPTNYDVLYGFEGLLISKPPTAYISFPPTSNNEWRDPGQREYLCSIDLSRHPEIRSRISSHVLGEVVRIDGRVHDVNGRLETELQYGKRKQPIEEGDLEYENVNKAEFPGLFGLDEIYSFSTDNTSKPIELIVQGQGSTLL